MNNYYHIDEIIRSGVLISCCNLPIRPQILRFDSKFKASSVESVKSKP
jgi:hypothetical protein